MSPETVTLEDALRLLSLPRVVGEAPDGEEVLARNGRYGPYIEKGKETRSLESEEQIFAIDLDAGARAARRAEGPPGPGRRPAAAPRARRRPLVRASSRRQGRPIRSIRDGRRDECEPAGGRRRRVAHPRPGGRAARRAPRQGAARSGARGGGSSHPAAVLEPANLFRRATSARSKEPPRPEYIITTYAFDSSQTPNAPVVRSDRGHPSRQAAWYLETRGESR